MQSLSPFSDNLYFTTFAFSREVHSIAERAFSEIGITPSDAYLLMNVNAKPKIQPTELSERILLAPSTITRMVEKLEKRNLVQRSSYSKYTYITATEKGVELNDRIMETWVKIDDTYRAVFGEDFQKVIQNNEFALERTKKR